MQIHEITIRNLGVIDTVQLALAPGLTVVTGETGAGKTMLVTALQLALGARADQQFVREGAAQATIDVICLDPPTSPLVESGLREAIISREIPANGRSIARVNGRPVAVATLDDLFGRHVEVHAQHSHVRLSQSTTQRELLDRYAGSEHADCLTRYAETFEQWHAAQQRYDAVLASAAERAREHDRLQFEVAEINAAEIDVVNDDKLDDQIARLAHAEQLADAARNASIKLDIDHGAAALAEAIQQLKSVRAYDDDLDRIADELSALTDEVVLLARRLRMYAESLDTDTQGLAELQERKHLLQGLRRKFGATLDDVLAYAADATRTLATFEADDPAALAALRDTHHTELLRCAKAVRAGRQRAAHQLSGEITAHLVDLGMPHATFHIDVAPGEPRRHGMDQVIFQLAANPGEPPRPIADAVSGGERSRVALAVEVALADVDDADVLVFDEVDAGIGGETALAVGEKLARLAGGINGRRRQVMCVTHLAQLAVFADRHYVVEKAVRDGRTHTAVRAVETDQREQELSRLLGGVVATAGVEHARLLMQTAKARLAQQN